MFDFARLERAVALLALRHEQLQKTNADLRTGLDERDARIRSLEEELRAANQLRQDVTKRIDELIGQIDQLDAQLDAQLDGSEL